MKLPKFRQILSRQPRKKLHATATARRAQNISGSYEDEEPQTRLSSAFVVVLILHVVAVGGIYAFNSIKAHRKARETVVATASAPAVRQSALSESEPVPRTERGAAPAQTPDRSAANAAAPIASEPVAKKSSRPSTPAATARPASTSKTTPPATYTVIKGDSLVGIARKLRVSYAELLKVNNIEDPNKLQVGRSLKVPPKK